MKLRKKDRFRSKGRGVNKEHDMVRVVIDCHIMEYVKYIKPYIKEIENDSK